MKYNHNGTWVEAKIAPFDMWSDGYIGLGIQDNGKYFTSFDLTYDEAEELYFRLGYALRHFKDMEEVCARADEHSELIELLENWR